MKSKKILTLALAAAMACVSVLSVSAVDLTETNSTGQTEVTATINGANPGDVSYVITIPEKVDFGVLEQPADASTDHYKDVDFTVTLKELHGLDEDAQKIAVYVRDQHAQVNIVSDFKITNKVDSTKEITYDVFNVAPNSITPTTSNINNNTLMKATGYYLTSFDTEGESLTGTLRLNQNWLCDYDISEIVGDYSGYMVFRSDIVDKDQANP